MDYGTAKQTKTFKCGTVMPLDHLQYPTFLTDLNEEQQQAYVHRILEANPENVREIIVQNVQPALEYKLVDLAQDTLFSRQWELAAMFAASRDYITSRSAIASLEIIERAAQIACGQTQVAALYKQIHDWWDGIDDGKFKVFLCRCLLFACCANPADQQVAQFVQCIQDTKQPSSAGAFSHHNPHVTIATRTSRWVRSWLIPLQTSLKLLLDESALNQVELFAATTQCPKCVFWMHEARTRNHLHRKLHMMQSTEQCHMIASSSIACRFRKPSLLCGRLGLHSSFSGARRALVPRPTVLRILDYPVPSECKEVPY